MATMAGYPVPMLFAAQASLAVDLSWAITAIHGAAVLQTLDLGTLPLLLTFIVIAALINLVIGSASAKWGIMAPVFVPMLYLLGISPEASQMAYRIGDSVSNVLTPLMPYFALVVAFMQRYDRRAGVGTLMAAMLPYSLPPPLVSATRRLDCLRLAPWPRRYDCPSLGASWDRVATGEINEGIGKAIIAFSRGAQAPAFLEKAPRKAWKKGVALRRTMDLGEIEAVR